MLITLLLIIDALIIICLWFIHRSIKAIIRAISVHDDGIEFLNKQCGGRHVVIAKDTKIRSAAERYKRF